MKEVRLNKDLLNIIIAVQNYKTFQLSDYFLKLSLDENIDYDWYSNVKDFFFAIDKKLIDKAGIDHDLSTLEKILSYQVPEDAETVEYHELGQYVFK